MNPIKNQVAQKMPTVPQGGVMGGIKRAASLKLPNLNPFKPQVANAQTPVTPVTPVAPEQPFSNAPDTMAQPAGDWIPSFWSGAQQTVGNQNMYNAPNQRYFILNKRDALPPTPNTPEASQMVNPQNGSIGFDPDSYRSYAAETSMLGNAVGKDPYGRARPYNVNSYLQSSQNRIVVPETPEGLASLTPEQRAMYTQAAGRANTYPNTEANQILDNQRLGQIDNDPQGRFISQGYGVNIKSKPIRR